MAAPKRFKSGNVEIRMNRELDDAVENILRAVIPETRKEMERSLSALKKDAEDRWPIRRDNWGNISDESQFSREKMYIQISINANKEIEAKVGNSAPYAWAIRVGKRTKGTNLAERKRVANELLWKPVRKRKGIADAITEALADEAIKLIGKRR